LKPTYYETYQIKTIPGVLQLTTHSHTDSSTLTLDASLHCLVTGACADDNIKIWQSSEKIKIKDQLTFGKNYPFFLNLQQIGLGFFLLTKGN
jgi:hypothetical protein